MKARASLGAALFPVALLAACASSDRPIESHFPGTPRPQGEFVVTVKGTAAAVRSIQTEINRFISTEPVKSVCRQLLETSAAEGMRSSHSQLAYECKVTPAQQVRPSEIVQRFAVAYGQGLLDSRATRQASLSGLVLAQDSGGAAGMTVTNSSQCVDRRCFGVRAYWHPACYQLC